MKKEPNPSRYTVINIHPGDSLPPEERAQLEAEIMSDLQNTIYRLWKAGTLFKEPQVQEG